MTTAHSPIGALRKQATNIARILKAAERGEKITGMFEDKIVAARGRESVKFGVMMDDKLLSIEMPWTKIRDTGEVALAEMIVHLMRETGDPEGTMH